MRTDMTKTTSFEQLYRDFVWDIPHEYNIGVDICDRHVDRQSDTALLLENAAGETSSLTFGELKAHSDRLGNALRSLGIGAGDRVGIILPQRAETAICHITLYKIGAIALPLSILFGTDAIAYRLADSGARAVVTDRNRAGMVSAIFDSLEQLDHHLCVDEGHQGLDFWALLRSAPAQLDIVTTLADDPALLIYTSGTTGPPKGALNAHRCLLGTLPGFELSHNFFPEDGDLMWTPADWAWTGGLLDALLPALRFGVPVLGYDGGKFDAERAFLLLEKYRVRNAFIPPTAMKMLMQVDDPAGRYDLGLRSIMSAGEQVGEEVVRWAIDVLGVKLNEMWGQTEFNYLVGNCAALMEVRAGSMGKPYPGHAVAPIDDQGRVMPPGEIGELAARCGDPVMFLGYWNNQQATREKIVDDWFRTGDLGYRDTEGYLWFVGRKDDVISSAGHRIGPGEIEDCLLTHRAVAQAAVIGIPDELRGQIVKAFVVLADGFAPSQTLVEDIQDTVRTRLAAYEYPRAIEFIDELPMTTTGKIRRIELRQR